MSPMIRCSGTVLRMVDSPPLPPPPFVGQRAGAALGDDQNNRI